jgi:hypothetical protein
LCAVWDPAVSRARGRLAERGLDWPVSLPMFAVFLWVSRRTIAWIRERLEADEKWARAIESAEYRAAREAFLASEIALRRQMEAVAAQLRALPAGGEVPEDYVFDAIDNADSAHWASESIHEPPIPVRIRKVLSNGRNRSEESEQSSLRLRHSMAKREFWNKHFEITANHPLSWQTWAHDLILTANILRRRIEADDKTYFDGIPDASGKPPGIPEHRTAPATLMVYAFAVENLAKAIRIAQGVRATDGLRLRRDTIAHHRVTSHVAATGVRTSQKDRKLLERMERFIERGRYPVQMKPHQKRYADAIYLPTDFTRTMSLLQRLENRLCELVRRPPCDLKQL